MLEILPYLSISFSYVPNVIFSSSCAFVDFCFASFAFPNSPVCVKAAIEIPASISNIIIITNNAINVIPLFLFIFIFFLSFVYFSYYLCFLFFNVFYFLLFQNFCLIFLFYCKKKSTLISNFYWMTLQGYSLLNVIIVYFRNFLHSYFNITSSFFQYFWNFKYYNILAYFYVCI